MVISDEKLNIESIQRSCIRNYVLSKIVAVCIYVLWYFILWMNSSVFDVKSFFLILSDLLVFLIIYVFLLDFLYKINFRNLVNFSTFYNVFYIMMVAILYYPYFPTGYVYLIPALLSLFMVNSSRFSIIVSVLTLLSAFAVFWFGKFSPLHIDFLNSYSISVISVVLPMLISFYFVIYGLSYIIKFNNIKQFLEAKLSLENTGKEEWKNVRKKDKLFVLFGEIKKHIEEKKSYLDPDFNLEQLSKEIGYSPKYVSNAINSTGKTNFPDFINTYRVEKILEDSERNKKQSLKSLYTKAGFNHYNRFSRAFTKVTGKTPALYFKENS